MLEVATWSRVGSAGPRSSRRFSLDPHILMLNFLECFSVRTLGA
jgi:hypothetical protein